MTRAAIVHLVTKLYAAAGAREATDVDFETYAEALEDLSDERGLQACREIIRGVDLVVRRPSPALVRQTAISIANREHLRWSNVLGLVEVTGQPLAGSAAQRWIARCREEGRRKGDEPRPISESLPDLRADRELSS